MTFQKNIATLLSRSALALGIASGSALAQTKPADPHAGHGAHAGHAMAKPANAAAAQSASTAAFEAANVKMHKDMAISFTGDADKDFLAGMIPHHQGAIDMAKVVLQHGKDPKVRKLAEEIIAAQQKEIADMQKWLQEMK